MRTYVRTYSKRTVKQVSSACQVNNALPAHWPSNRPRQECTNPSTLSHLPAREHSLRAPRKHFTAANRYKPTAAENKE